MVGSRFWKSAIVAVLFLTGSLVANAQTADYKLIKPAQPGGQNGQIEVIEFFSYECPHCSEFEPILEKWLPRLGKDVVFKRVPVSFGRSDWAQLARIYLTLNAMGLSDKLNGDVFRAIHVDRINMTNESSRNAWLSKHGVDVRKFDDTMRSFSVDAMSKRAEQQSEEYKIMAVPSLTVNGKYLVEGGSPQELKVVDSLIAKERAVAGKSAKK